MQKDISQKIIIATAVTSILSLGVTSYTEQAIAANTEMEKCAGIVKAGMNDCGANDHDCGGMSKVDSDPNEWMALPKGTCNKIVGANVVGNEKSQDIEKTEKCLGIVKAGMNDCGANGHSCAGKAAQNSDPNEWVYVPQGSCNKIVGASIKN